jgi:hydroxymethylpyrimidine/phosphomethylpyrimidine kinase
VSRIARVLIVAGSDSGGGAGIQADIKTVTMLGGYAMTAITAVTAQNTLGVQGVYPLTADQVIAQVDSVANDLGVDAIKIGMIGSAQIAHALADRLADFRGVPIVFDPVMIATSGSVLADADAIAAFERLMDLATLVTPNLPELAALGGEDQVCASGAAVLIKDGHGSGAEVVDRLVSDHGVREWRHPRLHVDHTHGTGCTLASAIATGLAQGLPLDQATGRGIAYVVQTLEKAPRLGKGHGPVGHTLGRRPFDELTA